MSRVLIGVKGPSALEGCFAQKQGTNRFQVYIYICFLFIYMFLCINISVYIDRYIYI